MAIAAPEPETVLQQPIVGEQRVVLHGISWESYLQILNALPQTRNARLTYDDGALEITMPLKDHEFSGRLIERFILTLVELLGMRLKTDGFNDNELPVFEKGCGTG